MWVSRRFGFVGFSVGSWTMCVGLQQSRRSSAKRGKLRQRPTLNQTSSNTVA